MFRQKHQANLLQKSTLTCTTFVRKDTQGRHRGHVWYRVEATPCMNTSVSLGKTTRQHRLLRLSDLGIVTAIFANNQLRYDL